MNLQKATEQYILEHPSVLDCMKKGIINYSKLSREICKELSVKNFDAVLIACRRFYSKLKSKNSKEKDILNLLKRSKIEIKNKVLAVVLEKDILLEPLINLEKEVKKNKETIHIVEGNSGITIVASDEFHDTIKRLFSRKILSMHRNLVGIIVKSPKELETTPGVMAHLYSLFGQNGINIVETMSCWTESLFVIDEKEINKTMEILRF